jgi:Protein of unknown function (DUF2806)
MSEEKNLININLGKWSEPAVVLIKKVSAAIGAIWEPHQIRRIAQAESDAAKMKALVDIEVTEIQKTALRRLIFEEGVRQENIERISASAASQLGAGANPDDMDLDWITSFFERARLASNQQMQSLWARLLAGEATKPGSYSKRTIDLVATLDKADAQLFTHLSCFCITEQEEPIPLIYDLNEDVYDRRGVGFSSLQHLESIGLIKFDDDGAFVLAGLPRRIVLKYFDERIHVQLSTRKKHNSLLVGCALLTESGKQLFKICGPTPILDFPRYLTKKFRKIGYKVLATP